MEIFYTNKFLDDLDSLYYNLINKQHVSFDSQAVDYVVRIYDALFNDISILGTSLPKAGKKYQLTKYGKPTHFVRYKVNARTTWYILVRIAEDRALITYIHNNHEKIHSIAKAKR